MTYKLGYNNNDDHISIWVNANLRTGRPWLGQTPLFVEWQSDIFTVTKKSGGKRDPVKAWHAMPLQPPDGIAR
jgi:hypothetical protein